MTTVHPFSDAPVLFLIGYGFRPAYQPADYIGPRMDCPMWLPAPDADLAYLAKWEAPAGHGLGFVLWPDMGNPITAAELAQSNVQNIHIAPPFTAGPLIPGPWHPPVDYPCNCITPDFPPVAPVPVMADAAVMLMTALAAFWLWRRK
ncbi:hypothetical protein [Paracoccus sp. SY]|uniref:hypothetical protein n=1 Tax=Paracoccus sp. SY TaxID=1330255 RepID=UPI000CD1CA48|nr:hypothetical protein [Paracoccus sp. SY]